MARYRSNYKKYRRSRSSTYRDREWRADVVEQVVIGILQAGGIVPPPGMTGLLARIQGVEVEKSGDTLYTELGRKVGEALGKIAATGAALPDGTLLVDKSKFGWYLAGEEPGMISTAVDNIGETIETMTGGLISPDGGGIDADALGILKTLASVLA